MLVWNHQLTLPTTASAEAIWRAWSDPSTWPQWDAGLDRVILNGPFVSGTTGTLTPKGGPTIRFKLLTVTPGSGFHDRSFLPLTTLDFIHTFSPATPNQPATITHRIEMRGWLTPLFRRVIGRGIVRDLPTTLASLARVASHVSVTT